MNYILLKIEMGNWLGGNDGQYPKIIEWELGCLDSPINESDGWGHGFGGGSSSLQTFSKGSGFGDLDSECSRWAFNVISNGLVNNLALEEIEKQLLCESQNHPVDLPVVLQGILNSRIRWLNA